MKTLRIVMAFCTVLLTLLIGSAVVQGAGTVTPPASYVPLSAQATPAATPASTPAANIRKPRVSILLWPTPLGQFITDYPSWESWLSDPALSNLSVRNELLVSVRAFATIIPDLAVSTPETGSDVISVSGDPTSIQVLLERLRDYPLLAKFTEDSAAQRNAAANVWAQSQRAIDPSKLVRRPIPAINARTPWVSNVVWGQIAPNITLTVRLARDVTHSLSVTARSNSDGAYRAYFVWEIRDGDLIELNDGLGIRRLVINAAQVTGQAATQRVTGAVRSTARIPGVTSDVPRSVEVIVGQTAQTVTINNQGSFGADFGNQPAAPGTPGFLRFADAGGNRVYQPFSLSIIRIRRDTSYSLPYGSVHSGGISSIVWGSVTAGATVTITHTRASKVLSIRNGLAASNGDFAISVDRLIEDGDTITVADGTVQRMVSIPTLTFQVNTLTKVITGIGPANITTNLFDAPHSLRISLPGYSPVMVTTTQTGAFSASLSAPAYLAGMLGSFMYTTPDLDQVYKPLFITDSSDRGQMGDWRADVILGQPDFSQITFNEVVDNKIFNPAGIYVDRSVQPNRTYVYDAGNNRVLGLRYLGVAQGGSEPGQPCTSNSDHPGSVCSVQPNRAADLVFGQASWNTSTCNGDSGYQRYPDVPPATAATLCGLREEQMSVSEGGSGATMATDAQGNLYVPDVFNNRVVRYNNPFATDTIADDVWGQADLTGIHCNRGTGYYGRASANGLCLSRPPGNGENYAGVAIDSAGNLWVADNANNRVLRFPYSAATGKPTQDADLVLGQMDFASISAGTGLAQMQFPASVRVTDSGVVYVADSGNNRVLVFAPPFTNGMSATRLLGSGLFVMPRGLEFDPSGGLWVNDSGHARFLYFLNETLQKTVAANDGRIWGGIGVDRDNNVMGAGWDLQQGLHFSPPAYGVDSRFLRSGPEDGAFNLTGQRGVNGGIGLEVAAGQLIYADNTRLLFWNNPWNLTNYQPADGVIGEPDFASRHRWAPQFGRMRADPNGKLWVVRGDLNSAAIHAYALPLTTGASPVITLTAPLPLQGGGSFSWRYTLYLGGVAVQPNCDCLWLADEESHRVFRIKNVSSSPVVDIVLGQLNLAGTQCNQGRGVDFPSRDSLCNPGALAFDNSGNLYVADHNLEFDGNLRLLEFDANVFPAAPGTAVFGLPATRVFGRNNNFTTRSCLPNYQDPLCGPWEPAFDSRGRMVIGFNSYVGGPRFPMVYQDPLTNRLPIAVLGDLHSMPLSARFDLFDHLYILDHNRSRILIYRSPGCVSLTTTSSPSGAGSINVNPTPNCNDYTRYTRGQTVTLTATANSGFVFSDWRGDAIGNTNPTTVTMDTNKNVTAWFKSLTTTALSLSANPSIFGQPITFTASITAVAPGVGIPTGTLSFKDGTTTMVTATLNNGTATYSTSLLAVGDHPITASYDGDSNFNASSSPEITQKVNKADTTTTLSSSANPSLVGQTLTFTATIAVLAPGSGDPTGTVTFKDGAATLGTGALSSNLATFSTSSLAPGPHSITAIYGGDTHYTSSTSSSLNQTVGNGNTTTTLRSSPNPSVFGQSVTFTASVTAVPPAAGISTGSVTLKDDMTSIGTAILSGGQVTFTVSTLAVGSHSISAIYNGDTNFNGSTSAALTLVVSKASTMTALESSIDPSTLGQSVTFTATVTTLAPGNAAPTGSVTFMDGSTPIGTSTLSGGKASLSTAALTAGSHSLAAVYGGDSNLNGSTSTLLTLMVKQASSTAVRSSPNPSVLGQSVTFTATVSPVPPGAGTPVGTVIFKDGTSVLGSADLTGGQAVLTASSLVPGIHIITVLFAGDTIFNGSVSPAFTHTVSRISTTTVVSHSPNPSIYGQAVTLAATVASMAPGSWTPGGTLTFMDETAILGTMTLNAGQAMLTISSLGAGTHQVTAVYSGDANYEGSTSTAVTQTVQPASTSVTLSSSKNPSEMGQPLILTAKVAILDPGSGTAIGMVTFKDGASILGTAHLISGNATFTLSTLPFGSHSITATYAGDANCLASTSLILTQVINGFDSILLPFISK